MPWCTAGLACLAGCAVRSSGLFAKGSVPPSSALNAKSDDPIGEVTIRTNDPAGLQPASDAILPYILNTAYELQSGI
jgi:hypothetical protein